MAAEADPTYEQDIRDRDLAFAQEDARREAGKNPILIKILSRSAIVKEDSIYRSGTDSNVEVT